jgi:hypothetical protein
MFNMLNTPTDHGKNRPLLGKILPLPAALSPDFVFRRRARAYLLERIGLRKRVVGTIGLRIAFPMARQAALRFRAGKA